MQNILMKLERLLVEQGLADFCSAIELSRHESSYADLRLLLNLQPATGPASLARLVAALESLPEVGSLRAGKNRLAVRLADGFIESVGHDLELGVTPAVEAPPDLQASRYLIGYLGANTSKALHLGHLRNIVIGNALTCAFAAVGARFESYSLVGDIGRNVCEAMAGFQQFHRGVDLERVQIKPDHFVGQCYQDYLGHVRNKLGGLGDEDDPCGREHVPANDLADDLLRRWHVGDPATRSLWRSFCEMVEAGHEATLAGLGIALDRCYYESEHLAQTLAFIERGLEQGILERLANGIVVYDSGRAEFERMVLIRSDGFPTEYARLLGVFHHILAERGAGCVHIDWNGAEWEPAHAVLGDLMLALSLIPANSVHRPVFYGMVLFDGEEISSSNGEPMLIDELLERVRQSPEVAALAESSRGTVDARAIADLVLKAFFLCATVSKPLTYSWARLMDPSVNAGWPIASAWCRASSRRATTNGSHDAWQPAYRIAVLQSQGFPRALINATRKIQLSSLTRFLFHFSAKYLASPPSERLDRVALTVLGAVFRSLGFIAADAPCSSAHT